MTAIQRGIVKQGKRNVIYRRLYAKNDKEKIAAWRSDLNSIFLAAHVRPIINSVGLWLTLHSQVEFSKVSNTQAMVMEMHHNMLRSDDPHLLVSDTRTPAVTE